MNQQKAALAESVEIPVAPKVEPKGRFNRRFFLVTGSGSAVSYAFGRLLGGKRVEAKSKPPKEVKIVEFSPSGQRESEVTVPMVVKTDAEWRKQLSPAAYEITREAGTEIAYSGKYWNLEEKGLFRCICCDTALFSSDTKFDSGTGWPSFWEPIAKENVLESTDLSMGMIRKAVACRRCNAHLGHVFDDGPKPTYLRYCMNSVALNFVKST